MLNCVFMGTVSGNLRVSLTQPSYNVSNLRQSCEEMMFDVRETKALKSRSEDQTQ